MIDFLLERATKFPTGVTLVNHSDVSSLMHDKLLMALGQSVIAYNIERIPEDLIVKVEIKSIKLQGAVGFFNEDANKYVGIGHAKGNNAKSRTAVASDLRLQWPDDNSLVSK